MKNILKNRDVRIRLIVLATILFVILASVFVRMEPFNCVPKFESWPPVEVQTAWRVDDKQNVYLDVSVTNKSNRTINVLEGVHFPYAYDSEGSLLSRKINTSKSLLTDNEKIKKGETWSASLSTFTLDDDIDLIKCSFYITWIGWTFYEGKAGIGGHSNSDIGLGSNGNVFRYYNEFQV